jgi:hypothetical protein
MVEEPVWICATCGVEHSRADGVCAICTDERQWVPADGQNWTTLTELAQSGRRVRATGVELGLLGLTVEPKVGIGQTCQSGSGDGHVLTQLSEPDPFVGGRCGAADPGGGGSGL